MVGGDLTCTECGLVAEAHVLLEPEPRVFWGSDRSEALEQCRQPRVRCEYVARPHLARLRQDRDYAHLLDSGMFSEVPADILEAMSEAILQRERKLKDLRANKRACLAVAYYYTCLPRPGFGQSKAETLVRFCVDTDSFTRIARLFSGGPPSSAKAAGGGKKAAVASLREQDLVHRWVYRVLASLPGYSQRRDAAMCFKLEDLAMRVVGKYKACMRQDGSAAPSSLAAAAVYMACMYEQSRAKRPHPLLSRVRMVHVADVCGLSQATLADTEKLLKKVLDMSGSTAAAQ